MTVELKYKIMEIRLKLNRSRILFYHTFTNIQRTLPLLICLSRQIQYLEEHHLGGQKSMRFTLIYLVIENIYMNKSWLK